ncbi:hypothetical protein [Parapedobacter tibetensis]|uniref:hypothetical protein n=1 Tax=Parapedobacter tibetensis TaxID=2972951 RepID=UPI00214D8F94|nr:hypothetical protein [Parapedobacter tibetensis]
MERGMQLFFVAIFGAFLMAINVYCQTAFTGSSTDSVIFVASTPCSAGTRPLPGIPAKAACELIKWELKLFGGSEAQQSGTYMLDCDFGEPKQGTKELMHGGTHLHRDGKWMIVNGTETDPSAIIYQLDPDKPGESVSFLRLNENLIHLLDNEQQLMIGNGGWSYTLNRIKR